VYAKAYMDEKKLVQKTSIYQAYLISRWVWQKKVDIEKILNTEKQKKEMSDEQMFEKVKALNAIFGGEVITCNS
jgi:hypothetical protein